MINIEHLTEINAKINSQYSGFVKEFHKRIWQTDFDIYRNRIENIDFTNFENILDAGCGFGQWSLALSEKNTCVFSIDSDKQKIDDLKFIASELNIGNVSAKVEEIGSTGFQDNFFNAVFCYSVIYLTDYKKTIKEFARILKLGGMLYLCSNGLGWYLHNLIGQIDTSVLDHQQMAIDAIRNTINYLTGKEYDDSKQLITQGSAIVQELEEAGFYIDFYGGEGTFSAILGSKNLSFYQPEYFGEEGVYEIIATRNK